MIELLLPWVLLALPIPLIMYLLPAKNHNQAAALKMPILIQESSSQTFSAKTKKSPRFLFLLIWALVVISASQPQWLGEAVNVPTEGREMMIAVDLSGSMQVEDMQLNEAPSTV